MVTQICIDDTLLSTFHFKFAIHKIMFWFVKKEGVLGQQQNAQGTNTYDTMNEIFKDGGIFDNLPSVSLTECLEKLFRTDLVFFCF